MTAYNGVKSLAPVFGVQWICGYAVLGEDMKINQIPTIDDKKGDWIILADYGSEGLCVLGQYKTPEEAIKNLGGAGGVPQAIVKLPDFTFSCGDA